MSETDYSENFERVWKIYPKRNGKKVGKFDAFKVWKTLSADEKRAAYSDIEKRNRQRVWDYVKDMHRYLKARGWEDEIESPQADAFNRSMPDAKQPEVPMTWDEVMLGRLFFAYVVGANNPLPDSAEKAIKIASNIRRDVVPAYQEDIDAETTDDGRRSVLRAACREIASIYLKHMDEAYSTSLHDRVMHIATSQRWERAA